MRFLILFLLGMLVPFISLASAPKPASIQINVAKLVPVSCFGAKDGAIDLAVSGGQPPYAFLWSNGATDQNIAGLSAGKYGCTVTDATGASNVLAEVPVPEPAPLAAALDSVQHVNCLHPTGYLAVKIAGGTAPYAYQWSNGLNTAFGQDIPAGSYTITTTDSKGCTTVWSSAVQQNTTAPLANAGPDLQGQCSNSVITLNGSGSTGNAFAHQWTAFNSGKIKSDAQTLHPVIEHVGSFVLLVTDLQNGCTAVDTTIVTSTYPAPVLSLTTGTITCLKPSIILKASYSTPGTGVGLWTGPNGFSSSAPSPSVSVAGVYTFIFTDTTTTCSNLASGTVAIDTVRPVASAWGGGLVTCAQPAAYLYSSGTPANSTFLWSGPGGYAAAVQNPVVNPAAPGLYTVQVMHPANGCTASASVAVTANTTAPSVTATGGTLTCTVSSVTLNVSTNIKNPIFSWAGPGFSSALPNPTVSQSGNYTVTVLNPTNGCTSAATVAVASNTTAPTATASGVTLTCATPAAPILASSTTPGATFAWTGPGNFTANVPNPTVTVSGQYAVTVTNPANGCTRTVQVFVWEDKVAPSVYAGADRSLNCYFTTILTNPFVNPTGTYMTYLWTTDDGHIASGATTLYARLDMPGTYTLTVKNKQNGCSTSDDLVVIQPQPVAVFVQNTAEVSCYGGNNGVLNALGDGGVGLYQYNWSNGAKTEAIQNLPAGTYAVTITDEDGCSATASGTVGQPTLLQVNVMTTPQTTVGKSDGTATATPSGGTFHYAYKWNTGATIPTITGLAPGGYTVTITDVKGCTAVASASVNPVSCTLAATVATTAVSCFGASNGSATANLSGGANPVAYLWSNGAKTFTLPNLPAGNYTVTATDFKGCSVVASGTVTSPAALTASIASQTNVLCPESKTGAVTIGATGGTASYNYAWSNGNNGATVTGLGIGTISCTVSDAKGCTKTQSATITATDKNPPQLALRNASLTLDAAGKVDITPALLDNGSADAECGIATWSVTPNQLDCRHVGPNIITLTATDKNGNTTSGTAVLTLLDGVPPTLACPPDQTVSGCAATVIYPLPQITDNCTPTGDPVLSSGLPSGATFPTGVTQQVFRYTDAGGNTGTCSFAVTVANNMSVSATSYGPTCAAACNGSALAVAEGGVPPYAYTWSDGQQSAAATGLCAGGHRVTVSDAAGCQSVQTVNLVPAGQETMSVSAVLAPASCTAACDGSAALQCSGDNQAVSILWDNNQTGATRTDLCPGQYVATLTDAAGCSQVQTVDITVQDAVAPLMSCPANISTGNCSPVVVYGLPTVTDNCPVDPQQILLESGLPSGTAFPVGTTVQTFRYTDSGGNQAQCSFSVTVHAPPAVAIVAENVRCHGLCDGMAQVNTTGGTSPLAIAWSNNTTGNSISGLCPGTYTATITDADGCPLQRTVSIAEPSELTLLVEKVVQDAGGAGTGSISITMLGGTPPYTYVWARNGLFYATTEDLSALSAGQYQLSVTDANGCSVVSLAIPVSAVVATGAPDDQLAWRLYPNPVLSDEVFLSAGNAFPAGNWRIGIYDMTGRLWREEGLNAAGADRARIALPDLPAGLWLLRCSDGRQHWSQVFRKIQ